MLAIDTNVVVRYLTGDNPKQAAQARTLIDGNDIFVNVTVLLETELVLRSVFGYPAVTVAKGLRSFGGLPNVTMEGAPIVAQALDWFEGGMDFADALHLAQASGCEAFVSFDRGLILLAKALKGPPARLP